MQATGQLLNLTGQLMTARYGANVRTQQVRRSLKALIWCALVLSAPIQFGRYVRLKPLKAQAASL